VDVDPTSAGREPSAAELNMVASVLAGRCAVNGDRADREEALRLSRQARESAHGDSDSELEATVASVLHDRANTYRVQVRRGVARQHLPLHLGRSLKPSRSGTSRSANVANGNTASDWTPPARRTRPVAAPAA